MLNAYTLYVIIFLLIGQVKKLNLRYVEELPCAEKWLKLRKTTGLNAYNRPIDIAQKGLDNSLYGISVYSNDELIGMARVIGDGYTCFYVQDVIVNPNYQGKGIGKKIMKKIMTYLDNVEENAIVALMSAKGKESFYEQFGFIKRPNDTYGCGMIRKKK